MRVLVTGHNGFIGSVLTDVLQGEGHDVVGLDNDMFAECVFGSDVRRVVSIQKDIRDVTVADLDGFDAVCHLAGISNDPVGDLDPNLTSEINHLATVRLAESAKKGGVERFVFSSSCSIYGASPGATVDETAPINPVTAYGWSKVNAESDLIKLADDDFTPVMLRNATAYGVSSHLRADVVVNNLVGFAMIQGRVLMKSDGSPWRPLIHIEDISRAFAAVLSAARDRVHNQIFNVAVPGESYQIREVAKLVEERVEGASVELANTAGPDIRDYRVDSSKFLDAVPEFVPRWTVPTGIDQLREAFAAYGTEEDEFLGRFMRIAWIKRCQALSELSADLRVVN